MGTSLNIQRTKTVSPFRDFLLWLLKRDDIRIMTVYIEYFKEKDGDADPIVLKFGHKGAFNAK